MLLHVWQFLLYCGETAMKLHYTVLKRGIWNAFETDQNEFYKVFIYFVPFSWLLSQPSSFERIRDRDYGRRVVILWDRLVIHNERPHFVLLKMCLDNLQIPPFFSKGPALEHCPSLAIWFLWNYGYGPVSASCSWCLILCFGWTKQPSVCFLLSHVMDFHEIAVISVLRNISFPLSHRCLWRLVRIGTMRKHGFSSASWLVLD